MMSDPVDENPLRLLSLGESGRAKTLRTRSRAEQAYVYDLFFSILNDWRCEWSLPEAATPSSIQAVQQVWVTDAISPRFQDWGYDWFVRDGVSKHQTTRADAATWQIQLKLTAGSKPTNEFSPLESFTLAVWPDGGPQPGFPRSLEPGSMAGSLAELMWNDFWSRLSRLVPIKTEGVELAHAFSFERGATNLLSVGAFSGDLMVEMQLPGLRMRAHLAATRVDAILAGFFSAPGTGAEASSGPTGEMIALNVAIDKRALTLQAYLDSAEVAIGQITSLKVGEVIGLSHRLDQPAELRSDSGERVALAWLGQTRGRKSLELEI